MKLKKIIYITICFALVLSFIFIIVTAYSRLSVLTSESAVDDNIHTIIIDAGHGGEDGGAVNENNVVEKDLNLQISTKLSDMLTLFGYNTQQIRTEDKSVCTAGDTVRQRKVSDMKNRLAVFNSSPDNIVISIHQNKFTESKYSGTQVFYSPNNPQSAELAESIRNSVKTMLQPENERECKKADKSIYLLKNTTVPAVITECGFISNNEECAKLQDNLYQQKMAYAIAIGLMNVY